MRVMIISALRILCDMEAVRVWFPGSMGCFEVLKNHAPLLSSLKAGEIVCVGEDGRRVTVPVVSGCVRVLNDRIEACVETVE